MTETVHRRPAVPRKAPAHKGSGRGTAGRASKAGATASVQSVLSPGGIAAGWALGSGLIAVTLPVLLIWAADGRSSADSVEAARSAVQLWLLAHGAALQLPHGLLGLTPLGLAALPVALLHRGGRHSVRLLSVTTLGQAGRLVAAIALPYALVATCLTVVAATETVQPDPVRGVLGALAVALVGAGSGVLREAGLLRRVRQLPAQARRLAVAAGAAVALLLAAGLALVVMALVLHADRVATLSGATGAGIVGGGGLVLLQLLLGPNAAIWGASWLSGPGFAVGTGTEVSPWGTTLGSVPALPMMAGLPSDAPSTAVAVLSLAVPLAAGVFAAVLLLRRLGPSTVGHAAFEGALVGPAAGLAMMLLAFVSGGPLGDGRLAAVGPSPAWIGLAVAVQVGAWCAISAVALTYRQRGR
jgi:hypothetical protein